MSITVPMRAERVFLAVVFLFAVFLSLKYFPGLENETDYAGNVFQTIHPDAFTGEPWNNPEKPFLMRPTQLSLFYGLVKLTGEIWLDDRFVAVVYMGLVFLSLLGIDRIARLLGITDPFERFVILSLFLKDHQIIRNNVLVAHHPDANHFAFAIPIIIWLIYAALARKGLFVVLSLSLLAALMSFRNGIIPSAIALVLVALHGGTRERVMVGGLFAAGLVVAYAGLFHIYAMPDAVRLEIWPKIVKLEQWAANPFASHEFSDIVTRNVIWLGICAGAYFAPGHKSQAFKDIKLILVLGLAIWLVSGLYVEFAPDALKMPMLLSLSPLRSLAVQQNLAYVAISAGFFLWLREERTVGRVGIVAFGLFILVLIGPGDVAKWSGLMAVAVGVVFVLGMAARWQSTAGVGVMDAVVSWIVGRPALLFAQVLGLTFAVALSVAAWQKAPAWKTLLQDGVYGFATSAKWIGVDRYIRENTPPTASVLPLFYSPLKGTLMGDGALRTRTGRAVPVLEYYRDILNPKWSRFEAEQRNALVDVGDAFLSGDLAAAAKAVERLVPVPDYIVLPSDRLGLLNDPAFPYAEETRIGAFTVLSRR
jgi:hypothetical protein